MQTLRQALYGWDGKSASAIRHIYTEYSVDADFLTQLMQLIQVPELQPGVTWLLKASLEHGQDLNAQLQATLLDAFVTIDAWQAQLHILQSFAYLSVDQLRKTAVEAKLRYGLRHPNKFVRAWSYHGLYHLALQYPELQSDVTQLLEMALKDEPASVKARVKKLVKQGF
ncbi:hypothetical protein [Bowmanella denitrificans]|uniref:hypothetical protein n=1 Tax=Bowmanella denitrificans TaxID=366582 RepID=UPI000C9B75E5|nr:hypothetical protein [Bowmanella denitrificans]